MCLWRARIVVLGCLLWLVVGLPVARGATEAASGDLRVEVIASYNLVVDSNGQQAPSAAYLGARYYNDGTTDLTDVFAYIGSRHSQHPRAQCRRTGVLAEPLTGEESACRLALCRKGLANPVVGPLSPVPVVVLSPCGPRLASRWHALHFPGVQ